MSKKKSLIFFLIFILLHSCSFDDKTGIWSGSKKEKERIAELERKQRQILDRQKIYSSEKANIEEILLKKKIILSKSQKNKSWKESGLNNQNLLGNIYLSGTDKKFLNKRIGKNNFNLSKSLPSPIIHNDTIIYSDNNGGIYKVNLNGKVLWKQNIYKKIYKKVYKILNFTIYKNNVFIADNIGFVYSLNLKTGKLYWIKNHGVPLRSNIKIYNDKIFLINQDNRILCFNVKDGSKVWDIRTVNSFIKSQNYLSLAISEKGDLIVLNSSGDLMKIHENDGRIIWSLNVSTSLFETSTDFFESSTVVINDNNIFFSAGSLTFSHSLDNGFINWESNASTGGIPIIDEKNIFFVTRRGNFIIMDKYTGKIISSNNILKVLKKRKQETQVTGFILGSEKIYSVTLNGYLIVSSATSGKVENFKKISDSIISSPIITNGNLYILTAKSKIMGFK